MYPAISHKKTDLEQINTPKKTSAGLLFMKNWITHPFTTAAQVPSSTYLADAMIKAVLSEMKGPIVEFGPGTGAITDRLLHHGCDVKDLILVEQNKDFCGYLRSRYRGATLIQNDALSALEDLKGVNANGVLSGMPLIQFPKRERIVFVKKSLTDLVKPGGKLSQFTYFFESPLVVGSKSQITATASERIWRNLWPAVVWTYGLAEEKKS